MAHSVPGPALPPRPGTLLDQGLGKPQEEIVSAVHGAPYRSPSIIRRSITANQQELKGGCLPLSAAADEAGVFPHPLCGDTPQRPQNKQQQQPPKELRSSRAQGDGESLRAALVLASLRASLPSGLRLACGHFPHPLHLLPSQAWAWAKACLKRDTAKPFQTFYKTSDK